MTRKLIKRIEPAGKVITERVYEKIMHKLTQEGRNDQTNLRLLRNICNQVCKEQTEKLGGEIVNQVVIQKIEDRVYNQFAHMVNHPFPTNPVMQQMLGAQIYRKNGVSDMKKRAAETRGENV